MLARASATSTQAKTPHQPFTMFDTLPASSPRISMVMAYSPANVFQPPKSVLGTMVRVDQVHQLGRYEYFREKAWHCSQVLKGYTETVKYT